jgi:hypothetical protein
MFLMHFINKSPFATQTMVASRAAQKLQNNPALLLSKHYLQNL